MRTGRQLVMLGMAVALAACAGRSGGGAMEEPPARCPIFNLEELYHADGSPPPPQVMYQAAEAYQGAVVDYRKRRYAEAGLEFFAVARLLVNVPVDCGYYTTAETNRLIAYRSALFSYAMDGQLDEGLKYLGAAKKNDAALLGEIEKLEAAPPEECKR